MKRVARWTSLMKLLAVLVYVFPFPSPFPSRQTHALPT